MSRRHPARRHRPRVAGQAPGTLTVDPRADRPRVRILAYSPDGCEGKEVRDLEEIRGYLDRWPVTWVDVDGLGDLETFQYFGKLFGLHRLALEDVLSLHQRSKVESYDNHLFLVVRMIECRPIVQTEQLSMFVGERFVLTFQEEQPGNCLDPVRRRIREGLGGIRSLGTEYLAYALLDAVVDAYFPYIDDVSDRIEALETEVVEHPTTDTVARIHATRRELLSIRRTISPLRETLNALLRDTVQPFTPSTRVYLRDCYDHVIHIFDMIESYREVTSGLLDVYLSSVSNRMNEIIKVLTIITTLFIPLGFLAGLYGMNFNTGSSPYNMPELNHRYGYPVLLFVMVAITVFQLVVYWRKGWLGGRDGKDAVRRGARPAPDGAPDTPSDAEPGA